jgi:hypothetical protein
MAMDNSIFFISVGFEFGLVGWCERFAARFTYYASRMPNPAQPLSSRGKPAHFSKRKII